MESKDDKEISIRELGQHGVQNDRRICLSEISEHDVSILASRTLGG